MPGMLKSRKVWAAIVGLIFILVNAALNQQGLDPDTVTNAIMGIVIALMGSIAYEDGQKAKAAIPPTTTVSTPGASDVSVIAPPTETAAPTPMLDRMG